VEKLAKQVAQWIVNNGGKKENQKIYAYEIERIFNTLIIFGITIIFGIAVKKAVITLIWYLFFLPLRHTSGGIHAKSHLGCFAVSFLIGIGCIELNRFLAGNIWFIVGGILFSIVSVFLFAPVIHPNHPLSKDRILKTKTVARIIVIIESCVACIFFIGFKFNKICAAAVLGMLAATVSTFVGGLKAIARR